MVRLSWSKKFGSKRQATIAMSKKKKIGYKVSGVYPTPDKKYFFVAEKRKKR